MPMAAFLQFHVTKNKTMKNFKIIVAILMLAKVGAYGQEVKLQRVPISELTKVKLGSNYYFYNDNLNKFVGTWVGETGNKRVKISFYKKGMRVNQTDNNEVEFLTGYFQYAENGEMKANYNGEDVLHASAYNADTLSILIYVKSRKAQEALSASYLQDGTIKLEVGQPIYESRNDKNFELKDAIILTKQN
jgi:hypothetical protein